MHVRSIVVASIFLSVPVLAQSPEKILDGSFIRSVPNAWKLTGASPGGQTKDGGIWKDHIEVVERDWTFDMVKDA